MSDFTFPKKEKLKSKKLIEQLFVEGKSVSVFPIKLIYLPIEFTDDTAFKAGVSAPKRNFKSAVKRNRIKRLMRESYRQNKQELFNNSEGSFAFLFLYLGKEMPTYGKIDHTMQQVITRFLNKNKANGNGK